MLSRAVGWNQHDIVHIPHRLASQNRNIHGTSQVCGYPDGEQPTGCGDLGQGRLMIKGGRSRSLGNRSLEQRLANTFCHRIIRIGPSLDEGTAHFAV